jgi:hypothetical protein
VAGGVTMMLFFHVLINCGMVMGMLPVVGRAVAAGVLRRQQHGGLGAGNRPVAQRLRQPEPAARTTYAEISIFLSVAAMSVMLSPLFN